MKIDQYCQRQRYKHVELEQFWQAFASRGFVSDSWAFLYYARQYNAIASVRPSVRRWYHRKTVEVRIMKFSPYGSPVPLVFAGYVSSRNSKGFPLAGASKKSGVGNFCDFLALNVNNSKTVADTAKVTIND